MSKKILAFVLALVLVCSLVPAVSAAETSATIDFSTTAQRVSQDDNAQVWQNDGLTMTNEKNESTQPIKDYSNPVRLYAKTNLLVEYAGMTKLVAVCKTTGYADALVNSIGTQEGVTVVKEDSVDSLWPVTVTFAAPVDSLKIDAFTAQTRFVTLTAYAGGEIAPVDPSEPEATEPEATEPEATEPAASEPAADSVLTIAEAIALGASKDHNTYTAGKYYVTGVISEVYNTTYGNMYLADDAGNTFCIYGTYSADGSTRYDALDVKPVAGDTVTIYGAIGQYNGTPQIKNGWITEHIPGEGTEDTTPTEPAVPDGTVLTIAEAIELGKAQNHNTYTTTKYKVTGTIADVYNTTYGNMYITDGTNTLHIYGTYSADGSARYDAMEVKPVAGDTVTIYGAVGQYSGDPQIKNGWIVEHTIGEPPVTEPVEEPDASISFADVANRVSQDTAQQVWQQNGITVTNDKGESTSDIIDSSNPVRFYKNSVVTIEAKGMSKIIIHCNNLTYANQLMASLPETVVATQDLNDITIELAEATDSFAVTLSGGQVRVNSIDIYFAEGGEEEVKGDLTGDGVVTNDDVIVLLWHSMFPEENPVEGNVDYNGDGVVTNDDVIVLLWHSMFPEENPL